MKKDKLENIQNKAAIIIVTGTTKLISIHTLNEEIVWDF